MSRNIEDKTSGEAIDLGLEAGFDLRTLRVEPQLCEVTTPRETVRLQPRVMQVLVALAQADGQLVSRDQLVERCWGGLAIGEDAINRCIQRIRRLSEKQGEGAFVIQTVPRVGYRLIAAKLATADEASPSLDASPVARTQGWWSNSLAWATSRQMISWIMGAGVLVFAALFACMGLWRAEVTPNAQVIAITPLKALSSDGQSRALAAAIRDEVISTLNLNSIRTVSPETASGLEGPGGRAEAAALKVRFILEGDVNRDDQTLSVHLRLNDALRRVTLWSLAFDRPADKAHAFEQEVATDTAKALNCALRATKSRTAIDDTVISLLLQACGVSRGSDLSEVRRRFDAVIARAPRLAMAYSELGVAYLVAAQHLPETEGDAALAQAAFFAKKALEIDDKDGQAYGLLAALLPPHTWAEQEHLWREGLEKEPDNADLHMGLASFYRAVGRGEEGLEMAKRGASLKPPAPVTTANVAKALLETGRTNQARDLIEHAAQVWPKSSQVRQDRFRIALFSGDVDHAEALLEDPSARQNDVEALAVAAWRAVIRAFRSRNPDDQRVARDLVVQAMRAKQLDLTITVRLLAAMDQLDDAFLLAKDQDFWIGYLFPPEVAPLRRDPRFLPFVNKLGLVAYWRRSGHWPDFCSAPDRPYDCRVEAAKLAGKP